MTLIIMGSIRLLLSILWQILWIHSDRCLGPAEPPIAPHPTILRDPGHICTAIGFSRAMDPIDNGASKESSGTSRSFDTHWLMFESWARFLSLARSKHRLCSANHRAGYFSNLACDWLSIVWAYSQQETGNGSWFVTALQLTMFHGFFLYLAVTNFSYTRTPDYGVFISVS